MLYVLTKKLHNKMVPARLVDGLWGWLYFFKFSGFQPFFEKHIAKYKGLLPVTDWYKKTEWVFSKTISETL